MITSQENTSMSATGTGTRQSDAGYDRMGRSGSSEAEQHAEGPVARTIEQQTAKLPSDLFLWAAGGAMGVSAFFELTGHEDKSRFFGQWVASLLLFGVYNKLVKVQGSDRV